MWNVLLKMSGDPLQVSTRAVASAALITAPVAGAAWLSAGRPGLPWQGWLLAGFSGLAELAYLVFLSEAYRRGEISLVYPLARGTAPLLTVPVGLILLGERLSRPELVGIVLLLAAIWIVQRPAATGPALLPALLTGVAIATYTTIDRVGVRLAPPWLYGWVLWAFTGALLLAWQRLPRYRFRASRWPAEAEDRPDWSQAVMIGLMMTTTYLLVLIALSLAPLSVVAPARESAIVLVTGWGIWRLGERTDAVLRLGGALAIVIGIGLLALT